MNSPDELRQEIAALRERISKLNAAILRISASLDLDTVLREVVDSARALTGARYGMIATVDKDGAIREFIASGLSANERRHMADWPHGYPFFEHLRDLPGALRLADLPAYIRSLGYTADLTLSKTLQATPIRHRRVHVGNFFLGEKAGGREFTGEDEDVLVLFASQAATAIANARARRDEQRARADLEALVDTSPVGVVVFDTKSGRAVSFNREARRIVAGLRTGDSPTEQLLEVMICRRGDGREIRLEELPLTLESHFTETVRAEEIELSVPDGRSVTTLVNATPIHSADGAVERMVVTLQDLAPLEELERLRAEFLGMVSHELRAPLTSIKGSTATVLTAVPELDPAEMREFFRIIDEQADHMRGLVGDLLDVGRIDTGTLSVHPEPSEVAGLVERARNTFLSGGGRHGVPIDLPPDLPRAMADRRRIVQVLNNLFSNASRHAPGSSPIRVTAVREGVYVAISVADQGQGVAPERLSHVFRKHAGFAGEVVAAGFAPGRPPTPRAGPERAPILVVDDDPQTLRYVRDETIARALEAGAADYIVKPFSPTELTARIGAALRKRAEPEAYVLGELAIHYEQRRVSLAGREVHLTATEYELLRVLSLNAGRVSTYDALLRHVWRGRHNGDTELVRTFVKKLRRKLGDDAANPTYIVNERRVGYRMARPGDA